LGLHPSKTLLRAPEVRSEADREPGIATPALDWPAIAAYRDWMTRHLDDQAQVQGYQDQGAVVVRGTGRLVGPGQVEVDGQRLEAGHVILATGSDPLRPPIQGLDQVEVWTNREATQLRSVPGRALLVGGGPVGIELGQLLARLGCQVTLVQRAERLLDREDPRVGELIRAALSDEGVDVRAGRQVVRASRHAGGALVELDDGATVCGWTTAARSSAPSGCGRSATSPGWRCSPTSPGTRAGSWPTTCSAGPGGQATGAFPGWSSQTRRSLPSGLPRHRPASPRPGMTW
jgi:pyruvate/2-oxoglutarate dehydrogenase complex dihydrolipoamide dehydrogenase (E3) component